MEQFVFWVVVIGIVAYAVYRLKQLAKKPTPVNPPLPTTPVVPRPGPDPINK